MHKYLILLLLLVIRIHGTSQPIIIDSTFKTIKITTQSEYYEDIRHQQNIEYIIQLSDEQWKQVPSIGLAKPQNPYAYWVRFDVEVQQSGDYYLTNEFTLLDTLVLFIVDSNGIVSKLSNLGDKVDINSRPIPYRVPVWAFHLDKGNYGLYVYADKLQSTCMMPLHLYSSQHFFKTVSVGENLNGIIFGLLISFIVISLLTGLYFRIKVYFYYSLHVFGMLLYLLSILGTGQVFIWDDFIEFNTFAQYLAVGITYVAFSLIFNESLFIRKKYPIYFRVIITFICMITIVAVSQYFLHDWVPQSKLTPLLRLGHVLMGLFPLVLLGICIAIYKHSKLRIALYFVLVFQFSLLSFILLPLVPLGIMPYETFGIMKWFYPIECFFLLMVLISDLYQSKLDKVKLQNQLLIEQANSSEKYLIGQRTERNRLAEQLHNSINLQLASLKMTFTNNAKREESDSSVVLIDKISDDLRRITHALSPLTLSRKGLIAAIEEEIFTIESRNSELNIRFSSEGVLTELTQTQSEVIYYSFLELIQNVLKHAKASHVWINLGITEHGNVVLEVTDDGIGYDRNMHKNGIGIDTIKARVELLRGTFNIVQNPNNTGMTHILTLN